MSLQKFVPLLKYLGAVIFAAALYRVIYLGLMLLWDDTRFLTYMVNGFFALAVALVVLYLVESRLIFPQAPRRDGLTLRYVIFLLGCAVVFCALSWGLQDLAGLSAGACKMIAGVAVALLGWFAQVKLVFLENAPKIHPFLTVLRNVVVCAALGACVFFACHLSGRVGIMYADYATIGIVEGNEASAVLENSSHQSAATVHANVKEAGIAEGAKGVDFAWDDAWFFADPTEYNHELAKVGIVLSAVANLESDQALNNKSNASELFSQMGFDTVSTTSYKHHTEIIDNLATMSTGATDTVSFALATKKISNQAGREKTLIAVAIRGSYGSEWLSDFNISGTEIPGYPGDHVGFAGASIVALSALDQELAAHEGEDTAVFICGHSRGAAVTGLMAAQLNQRAQGKKADGPVPGQVYAYAFATPVNTTNADANSSGYANIFNLLNPSDIVPSLPLPQWGYTRYGVSLNLLQYTDQGFDERNAAMRQFYQASFNQESPSEPADVLDINRAIQELHQALPTDTGLGSPGSLLALTHALVCDINAARVLSSHYLPTYISWVFTTDPSDMERG